jgi:hypothetical protein
VVILQTFPAIDRTNKLYFDELQATPGDEMEMYSHLLKTEAAEIKKRFNSVENAVSL